MGVIVIRLCVRVGMNSTSLSVVSCGSDVESTCGLDCDVLVDAACILKLFMCSCLHPTMVGRIRGARAVPETGGRVDG